MSTFNIAILSIVPLKDSEPATQFPDHVLVSYPSDKQTYDHQREPFYPVHLVVHFSGDLQYPS